MKHFKIYLAASVISSFVLFGFETNQVDDQEAKEPSTLKQNPSELLNGVVQAIAYSGFREGQHPDRGDGAVNPSYEETLEDLEE